MPDRFHSGTTAKVERPGFAPDRMVRLMEQAIARLKLDLAGVSVLTEAATGAYASTAVIAALAGAEWVYAFARDSRHGSCGEVARQTLSLARAAGVADRVEIVIGSPYDAAGKSLVVTNSGNLRPLDAELIGRLPSSAVVALMYEAWEFRHADIDMAACRRRGIPVVGVNERHPQVGVFPYLGCLAARELHDAGFAVHGCRIGLVCDNAFAPYLQNCLASLGGEIALAGSPNDLPDGPYDVLLVATRPGGRGALDASSVRALGDRFGALPLVQFWGDVDRDALAAAEMRVWPPEPPLAGHMAILFPAVGPEAVIRLQAGGLRAAELILRRGPAAAAPGSEAELVPWPLELRP
jgi:hypothetical protein